MKKPTKKNIETAKHLRNEVMNWKHRDILLYNEFERLSKNSDQKEVEHKIEILDYLYNCRLTRAINHNKAAELIVKEDIDNDLRSGDPIELVNRIKNLSGPKSGGQRRTNIGIVFASKYCHFHAPNRFPIYDQYAREGLIGLLDRDIEKRNYSQMKKGVDKVISNVELDLNYKDLDEYLWLYGQLLRHQLGEDIDIVSQYKEKFLNLTPR